MLQRYLQILMTGGKIVEAPKPLEDGLAAYAAGDHATAEGLLLAASTDQPDEPRMLAALGMIALQDGRAEEAAAYLVLARKKRPSDLTLIVALADAYRGMGQHEKAHDGYQAALRAQPTHAEAQRKLGETLYELGRTSEAIVALNQAVYRDRKDMVARLLIARISLEAQDVQRALAQLSLIAKVEPGRLDVHQLLADAFYAAGDYRQLAVELLAVHKLGGATLETWWRLANVHLMTGAREDALGAFQQAAVLESHPGSAHAAVAQVAEELGRDGLALEVWAVLAGEKAYQGEAHGAIARLRAGQGLRAA